VPTVLGELGEMVLVMHMLLLLAGGYLLLWPLALLVAPWFRSKVRPR
jgi:hypothetical protein